MIQTGSPSNWPISTIPGRRVSRTVLLGSSIDGASSSGVRSASCFLPTRTPMSICWAPELSIRSGGVPPLKRGCRTDWIFWVLENVILDLGYVFA